MNSSRIEVLHHARGKRQTLIVEREGTELRLKILSLESGEWQSRMDLQETTRLVAPYMQAMMLALLWRPEPARVHVLGLGGGRIPVFLRRLFPQLQIEGTEIDREVYELAVRFFGLRPDPRMQVIIGDGRAFLASRPPETLYDIIFVDAFCGIGCAPLRLASREFFAICRARLAPEGMVVVNVMPGDPLTTERLRTIAHSFRSACLYRGEGVLVAFASDAERIPLDELLRRAMALQTRHQSEFSFLAMTRAIERLDEQGSPLLTDLLSSDQVQIPDVLLRSVRPHDPCPCGSGREFESCHGTPGKRRGL